MGVRDRAWRGRSPAFVLVLAGACGCGVEDYPIAAGAPTQGTEGSSTGPGDDAASEATGHDTTGSEPADGACVPIGPGLCRIDVDEPVVIVDVDEDGIPDLLSGHGRYWRSNGVTLEDPVELFDGMHWTPTQVARDQPVVAGSGLVRDLRREGDSLVGRVGTAADSVLVDFDGDGRVDLVQVDDFHGLLRIALVTDDAMWPAVEPQWAGELRVTDTADLDGDGDHEMVAIAAAGDRVEIHGLAAPIVLPTGDIPSDAVVLPGVRGPRIVVTSVVAAELRVFDDVIGQPEAFVTLPMDPPPYALETGDLDGDGVVELLVVDWAGTLHVLAQDGGGGFVAAGSMPIATATHWFQTGDLDGDGRDEVLLGSRYAGRFEVVELEGGGLTSVTASTYASDVALGDLDGDGRAELLTATSYGVRLLDWPSLEPVWYLRDDDLGFQPRFIEVLDLDADGTTELVVGCSMVLEPETLQLRFVGTSIWRDCSDMALADLTGDGIDDLLMHEWRPSLGSEVVRTAYWRGDGLGRFGDQHVLPVGVEPEAIAGGDLDGDGEDELAVWLAGEDAIVVLDRSGAGWAETLRIPISDVRWLRMGDVDGDGRIDLLALHQEADLVVALLQDAAGGFQARPGWSASINSSSFFAVDLDGDGRDDLHAIERAEGSERQLIVRRSWADGFGPPESLLERPLGVFAGDLHGDGRLDFAVRTLDDFVVVLTP